MKTTMMPKNISIDSCSLFFVSNALIPMTASIPHKICLVSVIFRKSSVILNTDFMAFTPIIPIMNSMNAVFPVNTFRVSWSDSFSSDR